MRDRLLSIILVICSITLLGVGFFAHAPSQVSAASRPKISPTIIRMTADNIRTYLPGADTSTNSSGMSSGAPGHYCITNNNLSLYTAAERFYTGTNSGVDYAELRARTTALPTSSTAWESFTIIYDTTNTNGGILFRSNNNGLYVAAEMFYTGNYYAELRARTTAFPTSSTAWEEFSLFYNQTDNLWYIQSNNNGLFVAAEQNTNTYPVGTSYGLLRARTAWSSIDDTDSTAWEAFQFIPCL